jgi:hypothetical protein
MSTLQCVKPLGGIKTHLNATLASSKAPPIVVKTRTREICGGGVSLRSAIHLPVLPAGFITPQSDSWGRVRFFPPLARNLCPVVTTFARCPSSEAGLDRRNYQSQALAARTASDYL